MHPIIPWSMKFGNRKVHVQRLAISCDCVNYWCQVYQITNFVKLPVHWSPRLLVTTELVEGCSPSGCKASIASCQAIADHVAGQFQLRQTKNVNTTNTFRPYSYRTWILEGFFNPSFFTRKIHTWKWITSSLCGTFYEVTKLEHLRMPNLNSKRLWNNYLPAKLTEKGSPFYQILGISIKEPAVPISINHFC